MKSVLKQIAKSVLIPLGLTAVVSAAFACIHYSLYNFDSFGVEDIPNEITKFISSKVEIYWIIPIYSLFINIKGMIQYYWNIFNN